MSCERDDLCSDVPITPLLILTFDGEDNAGVQANVPFLQITSTKNNNTFFAAPTTTDSIAIPLDITLDNTQYIFTRNSGDANTDNILSDTITFFYNRRNEFVNRACGFRTIYSNLDTERETNNWITNSQIINSEVNDQLNAHIRLSF